MPRTTITNLPIQADGHNFWITSVDFFDNKITIGMPKVNVGFPALVAPSLSNVTNIFSTYTDINTLEVAERQEVYPVFEKVYELNITPVVVTAITSTTEYFSHFEIQVDSANTFDVSPSLHTLSHTQPTTGSYVSRPYTLSLRDGVTYYFRVRIYDVVGNVSAWSSTVSEEAGDTTAPDAVGSGNVTITTSGQYVTAVVDASYTQATDHSYYEWWTALTSTHPGGNGRQDFNRTFSVANKSGDTIYFFVAAVDASGNRSSGYTTNVGNSPYVSADYWTDIDNVTDTNGDPILDVTDRGLEDENGVTVIDFTSGTGINATLEGAIDFGTGGKLLLTDNSVSFSGTPVDGMEMIARGIKLYGDADNYMIMEKTGTGAVNVEIMGGTFRTGSATSYLTLDSTGIKSYNSSTQRVQILNDGSGWLGGASDFYWDSSGNVTIAGTVTVTNIAATTGTIAAFTIAANSLTSTLIGIHSAGYSEGAEILLGHATIYASAKIGLKADGSGKLADGSFLWDTAGDVTMSGTFTSTATITGGTIQTATSGARVVMNSSGIQGYDATTQRFNLDSDGSGWLGNSSDFYWDTDGNVFIGDLGVTHIEAVTGTIAAFTIAANSLTSTNIGIHSAGYSEGAEILIGHATAYASAEIGFKADGSGKLASGNFLWNTTGDVTMTGDFTSTATITGGTIRTGSGNAKVEMTSANGIRAYNSSAVQTVEIGTDGSGWFGLTGTRAITWNTSGAATIGGWSATEDIFRSATSAERIQLDATKNRISIFAATGDDKVAMGYLEGLGRNKAHGNATGGSSTYIDDTGQDWEVDQLIGLNISITGGTGAPQTRAITDNTATRIYASFSPAVDGTSDYAVVYTSNNYGFWALDGDYLMIDGDVTYESGDWIVHNDASLKIINGSGIEILRLGTDSGEKGLFIYDAATYPAKLAKYISDEIYVGVAGDYLQYTVGGGMTIEADVTLGSESSIAFGSTLIGANMMQPDVRLWHETTTPATDDDMGYFTNGSNPYGGDDNNNVSNSLNPFGQRDLVWECVPTASNTNDGGWQINTPFTIDRDLRYRYSAWVKQVGDNDGGVYFGLQDSTTHTSNLTADGSDSGNANPYFRGNFALPNTINFVTNAVTNGTMEIDNNWTSYNSPVTNARSAAQAHLGTYSRLISSDSIGEGIYSDTITLNGYQNYTLKVWLYGDGSAWSIYLDDGITSNQYYIKEFGSEIITPLSGEWSEHRLNFQIPERTTTARIYITSAEIGTNVIYVDDVWIGTDLITNGDFEEVESIQTAFSGWAHVGTPTTCERSTIQAHGGTYSWRITVNAASEGVQTSKVQLSNGTATATTTDKLVDSGASFDTDGTVIGDKIYNNDDNTCTTITAIDSASTLSIANNIFAINEDYIISSDTSYIKLIDGYQYRCSIWLYGNASNEWSAKVSDGTNDYDFLETDNTTTIVPAASWTEYILDFEASANTDTAYVEITSIDTSGTLYIDDVTLQETPWFLFVGYFHPDNYAGTESWGAIYHYKSGYKIPNLTITDYKSMSTTTTQEFRLMYYDSDTLTNRQFQYSPSIYAVDGTEPTISSMLGNSLSAAANIEGSTSITKYLVSSPEIRGGTITGGVLQTAINGQRVVIDGASNSMNFYDNTGTAVVRLDDNVWTTNPGIVIDSGVIYLKDPTAGGSYFLQKTGYFTLLNDGEPVGSGTTITYDWTDIGPNGVDARALHVRFADDSTAASTGYTGQRVAVWGDADIDGTVTSWDGIGVFGSASSAQSTGDTIGVKAQATGGANSYALQLYGVYGQVNFDLTDGGGVAKIIPTADNIRLYNSNETNYTDFEVNTSGYLTVRPSGSRIVVEDGGGAGGDQFQIYSDTNGYCNILPSGNRLNLVTSSYGTTTFYNNTSSESVIKTPSGNKVIFESANAINFAEFWMDGSNNFCITPNTSTIGVRLYDAAEGAGDYTDLYTDTSGQLNIVPYGGAGATTTGKLKLWDATHTAGDFVEMYSNVNGALVIDPGGLGTNLVSMNAAVGGSMLVVSYDSDTIQTDFALIGGMRVANASGTTGTQAGIHFNTSSAYAGIFGVRAGSNKQGLSFYTENEDDTPDRQVKANITYDGNFDVVLGSIQQAGADIINSSGQQTGNFKTKMALQFGTSVLISSTDDLLKGINGADPGIYRLAHDAVLESITISTISAIGIDSGEGVTIEVQVADGDSDTSFANANTALQLDSTDNGNLGKGVTGQSTAFQAGDRVRVNINIDVGSTVSLVDVQVVLYFLSE